MFGNQFPHVISSIAFKKSYIYGGCALDHNGEKLQLHHAIRPAPFVQTTPQIQLQYSKYKYKK